jgi:glucose-6-phosphate 1-dehydrogenase
MNDQVTLGHARLPTDATPAPPATMFIFGASGDLTKRLLMPAIYNLAFEGVLDPGFQIIGVDHIARSEDDYRAFLTESVRALIARSTDGTASIDEEVWSWLIGRIGYVAGDFGDPATYETLKSRIVPAADGSTNAVFYLAVAPRFFGSIPEQLAASGLLQEGEKSFRRIVIEKPFGSDLASAKALNAHLLGAAGEHQLFRIDHFLGKETVQNIMSLRFANGIFEPIWRREYIEHVQITAAETVGVEARGKFYDATGALRDMVPNHMFQLLATTAMEPPNSFDADAIRTEKAKAIEAIRIQSPGEAASWAVRGQYTAGSVLGQPVADYRAEPDVDPHSLTETYVAMKCLVDNWRWSGVPFYIRTGKALTTRRTEIAIQFKRAPGVLFGNTSPGGLAPNMLVIHVQPDEGISLRFAAKVPGRAVRLSEVDMDFRYKDYFQAQPSTGYETLIYDCLIGDATLFQRADNIEAGWAAVQPLLDAWRSRIGDLNPYAAGGSGPQAAHALIGRDGYSWLPLSGAPLR